MARQGTLYLKDRLAETARRLQTADSLEGLRDSLASEQRLWHRFRLGLRGTCCKSGELARLGDFVLATLRSGSLPDDRSIAALVSINLRACALIGQDCSRDCPTQEPPIGRTSPAEARLPIA